MVKIYYDTIDDEIKEVAHIISTAQKDDVIIITPTETLEVRYNEKSDGNV